MLSSLYKKLRHVRRLERLSPRLYVTTADVANGSPESSERSHLTYHALNRPRRCLQRTNARPYPQKKDVDNLLLNASLHHSKIAILSPFLTSKCSLRKCRFDCLCSCKDRATVRHRPNSRKKRNGRVVPTRAYQDQA